MWNDVLRDFLFDIGTAGLFAYLVHKKISSPFKNLVENMNRIYEIGEMKGSCVCRGNMETYW